MSLTGLTFLTRTEGKLPEPREKLTDDLVQPKRGVFEQGRSRCITLPPEAVRKLNLDAKNAQVYLTLSGEVMIITRQKEVDSKEPISIACKILAELVELVRRKEEIERKRIAKEMPPFEADTKLQKLMDHLSEIRSDLNKLLKEKVPDPALFFMQPSMDAIGLLELGSSLYKEGRRNWLSDTRASVEALVQEQRVIRELLSSSSHVREQSKEFRLIAGYQSRLSELDNAISEIKTVMETTTSK